MNQNTRMLIQCLVNGDVTRAKSYAAIVLKNESTKKDAQFCTEMLRKLESKPNLIELPYNLQELLVAEDSALFPVDKYFLRENDREVADYIMRLYKAAGKLASMGISYLPAAIFHGQSGCGKTELARYIAHAAELPFIYVRFSNVVGSLLGSTQSNVGKIFQYAKTTPCVLCFDEIDAVGMCRGQKNDVGEMNRIVIALMQELDQLPNNVIIIGTTNRFDRLDPALIRRFPTQYEVKPLDMDEAIGMARRFFEYAGVADKVTDWWNSYLIHELGKNDATPASAVVKLCTDKIVSMIVNGEIEKDEED